VPVDFWHKGSESPTNNHEVPAQSGAGGNAQGTGLTGVTWSRAFSIRRISAVGVRTLSEDLGIYETEEGTVSAGNQPVAYREIMDIKAAANYLGVSRSHFSHILAGKIPGVPAIPHVRAGRRALIRRTVIDRWILDQEHCQDQKSIAQ
jgi:hypothetical protein